MFPGVSLIFLSLQITPGLLPVSGLLDCAREADVTLVAVHRAGGFAPGIAENSLSGLRRAAELGAAFAEIDLRETADGEIILMHDATLDRTTTASGAVAEQTLEDLQAHYLVDSEGHRTADRIPTLAEAFEIARETGLYLELDLKGLSPARIAELALAEGMAGQSLIIIYDVEEAGAIQAVSTDIGISLPFTDRDIVLNSELQFSSLLAWAGRGVPDARTEAFLTGQGIETAIHDFPSEADGSIDYAFIDAQHVELLASDDPEAAVRAFGRWESYCRAD